MSSLRPWPRILPLVVVVMNNGYLGMVRQWQDLFNDGRTSSTRLRNNPDLVRMAEAYGAEGAHVERPSELSEAMTRGLGSDVPFIVDIDIDPSAYVYPMFVPRGAGPSNVIGKCPWG